MNFGICLNFVNKQFLIIKIHEITERLILWFLKFLPEPFQLVIFHCSIEMRKMLVWDQLKFKVLIILEFVPNINKNSTQNFNIIC